MLTFRPTKLDCDVATLCVSGLAETLAERFYTARERRGRFGSKIPNYRRGRRLLSSRRERPRLPRRRVAVMNSRRFIWRPSTCARVAWHKRHRASL